MRIMLLLFLNKLILTLNAPGHTRHIHACLIAGSPMSAIPGSMDFVNNRDDT